MKIALALVLPFFAAVPTFASHSCDDIPALRRILAEKAIEKCTGAGNYYSTCVNNLKCH